MRQLSQEMYVFCDCLAMCICFFWMSRMSTQEVEADWSGAAARSLEMTFTFRNVVCNGGRKLNTLQKIANCDDICHDR